MTQGGPAAEGCAISTTAALDRFVEPGRPAQGNVTEIGGVSRPGAVAPEQRVDAGGACPPQTGQQRVARPHLLPWFCLSVAIVSALLSGATAPSQVAMLVVFACAVVTSVAGFAFSPLAGALLFQIFEPVHTIEILLVASISIQTYSVWSIRKDIVARELTPYIAGGAVSVPFGVYLLLTTNSAVYIPLLGCFLVAYGAYVLLRPRLPSVDDTLAARVVIGVLGGLTAALAAFPGASISIWCRMQDWDKQTQRVTLQPYILTMQILVLGILALVRSRNALPFELIQFVAPAILGAYFGLGIYARLTTGQFNRVVALLLLISGVILTVRSL